MSDYSQTVHLPKTDFPMKADLPNREPGFLELWERLDVYRKLAQGKEGAEDFILHDGPPYANGHIHIGHALNKILKDMTVKARGLEGFRTPFVPGWDCHGLPIEQALLKELKTYKGGVKDPVQFRRDAASYARRWIDVQRTDFKRLGVLADWENPYTTMDPEYESAILRAFRVLLNAGFIYRGLKPVLWCAHDETALAEAEIEYKDKVSPSIYVAFPVRQGPFKSKNGEETYAAVWTTTPWTLPANVALAFHPEMRYVRVRLGGGPSPFSLEAMEPEAPASAPAKGGGGTAVLPRVQPKKAGAAQASRVLILAKDRLQAVMNDLKVADYEVLDERPGSEYEGLQADNPLNHSPSRGVLAMHVTAEDGTGIVHTAPGHGREDFETGQKYGLPVLSPVDAQGRFTREAGAFAGLKVSEGNEKIIESLRLRGRLLSSGDLSHSYPHCWRCKHPVIYRATEQWFLSVEHQGLRERLLKAADDVAWLPEVGRARIGGMLKTRPDWCLSRQRLWGVPIPIVYCQDCGKPQTDNEVLSAIETRVAKEGSDFWFAEEPQAFLPAGTRCGGCGEAKFRKETDILDVWMDSGCSWLGVLKARQEFPSALYLEGSDQHRGWFQSSLVLCTAMEGRAPYKSVLTHGFVLDESGRAMHKSLGNVVSPQTVVGQVGADVLRLWVALADYEGDVRLSPKLLEGPVDMYRKVRNTLRYLLGNLHDFDPAVDAVPYEKLQEIDRFTLHCLAFMIHEVREDFKHYRFRAAMRTMADFCINDLSSFYLDVLKDRLYVLKAGDPSRRGAQTVLYAVLTSLTRLLAPVLSFTAEESWQSLRDALKARGSSVKLEESVLLAGFPDPHEDWFQAGLELRWRRILDVREKVALELDRARKAGLLKSAQEAAIVLSSSEPETEKFLNACGGLWQDVLMAAKATVGPANGHPLSVKVEPVSWPKCPRCWQRREDIGRAHPEVCGRCAAALSPA